MNPSSEDILHIQHLLRRTGEFIAYFERVEDKMASWQEAIEQQAAQISETKQSLYDELAAVNSMLQEIGLPNFRVLSEKIQNQGEIHLNILEQACRQFDSNLLEQLDKLDILTENCISKIEQHGLHTLQNMETQLAKYNVSQFHRIASESCYTVERAANDAISKSNQLLHRFRFRYGFFAVFMTFITAFVIVLYLNDELPWEMHHHAMNERQAGKVLMQAWPNLSKDEKEKILSNSGLKYG